MSIEELRDKTYIGDGVYAGHDGYQVWLWTDREGVTHYIALEPPVLAALDRYAESLRQESEEGART